MDIQLPGMDGLHATALLKRDAATHHIPVIALTALAMKGDEERILAAGCDGYILETNAVQGVPQRSRGMVSRMKLNLEIPDRRSHVIVVDDERANRQLLEAMLAREGFDVRLAASGEEAIASVAHDPPDLILLDVMMPGMDGYEVARTVKGNVATPNIPIIMVTALDDRDARMRGLSAGAEDFLNKPVDSAELCVRVKNLLRLKAYGDFYGRYSETLEEEVRARTSDLADRTKRLEEQTSALRNSEERTNYALGGARMGVWELDIGTWRLTWSDTMASVLGLTSGEAPTGLDEFLALVHATDREPVREAITNAVRTEADFAMEFRVLWPDGTTRWMAGRARVMRDTQDNPLRLLGVGADISERKSLEAQLRQSQKMEAVGQLAGGVAHDFNNLLTVIVSYADMVIHDMRPGDPGHDDLLEVIKAAGSAAALTRQLLAFSRTQVLRPTTIDLNAVVTAMQEMLSRHWQRYRARHIARSPTRRGSRGSRPARTGTDESRRQCERRDAHGRTARDQRRRTPRSKALA